MAIKPQDSSRSQGPDCPTADAEGPREQVEQSANEPQSNGDFRLGCLTLTVSWILFAILIVLAVRLVQWLAG